MKLKWLLINVEINDNYIELYDNNKLNELQNITNFNEVKKILTIYKEKTELSEIFDKENLNKTIKNYSNKI